VHSKASWGEGGVRDDLALPRLVDLAITAGGWTLVEHLSRTSPACIPEAMDDRVSPAIQVAQYSIGAAPGEFRFANRIANLAIGVHTGGLAMTSQPVDLLAVGRSMPAAPSIGRFPIRAARWNPGGGSMSRIWPCRRSEKLA
jgi:hypothetical protein